MSCSSASTLKAQAAPSLLPISPPDTTGAWQRVRTTIQQILQMIQAAGGSVGNNVIPQQYALIAGSSLPPISATSNCTVSADASTPLFGAGGSYKVSITGSPATVTFSADTAWPIHPGWQWVVSFFQQASAAVSGAITVTTPKGSYTTDFTTTLAAGGWNRLFDTLNLGADTSTSFGLSVTFTGGTGQTVWLDGLMLEPYFNLVIQPSPFSSNSPPLTLDNNPDGTYAKPLATALTSGQVDLSKSGVISKTLANIADDAGSSRYAVLSIDGNRRALIDLSQAHLNKTLSNIADDNTYAKTRAALLTNGIPNVAPVGKNLLQNPGFEINTAGIGMISGPQNALLLDGWYVSGYQWYGTMGQSSLHTYSGSYALSIQNLMTTFSANTTYSARAASYRVPVLGGEVVYYGGWRFQDRNVSNPANVNTLTRLGIIFFDGTGATILETYVPDLTNVNPAWYYAEGVYTAPSNACYVQMELAQFIINNNSTSTTVSGVIGNAYFDNVFMHVQVGMDNEVQDGSTYFRMPSPPAVSAAAQTSLTQSGTTTTINVGSGTYYLGGHTVSAGSGSVTPASYGTSYIYFDLPDLITANVTPTYQASSTQLSITQSGLRVCVGQITTVSGGGGTGGGTLPPCFSGDTRVLTVDGYRRFDELPPEFEIVNHTGRHRARLLVHPDSLTPMRRMGPHLVTEEHLIRVDETGDVWLPASRLFHERAPIQPRTVYNMHVISKDPRDLHYLLENGLTAHNIKQ